MRRILHTLGAVVLAGTVVLHTVGMAAAAEAPDGVRSAESDRIDAWITERMEVHDTPGVAVGVVRDGQVTHLAGYGIADSDGRPVTADTPFLIGSSSKPFTALVVQQLVAEGRLSLDEPVWPHLAGLVNDPPPGFERATVAQLLNHTGGLGMLVGLAGTVDIHEGDDALDRRVVDLLAAPLSHSPGEAFEYSNAGPQLLAAVTEQVTGTPFADQLRARVFEPLDMERSFASGADPLAAELATGHRRWFGVWRPAELPYDDAGAAMGYVSSTARDLSRFLQAHLDGHPSVPATADEIAQERVVPTGMDIPGESEYGLGWSVGEIAGHRTVSHAGSLAHVTAHVVMAPDQGLGVVVLTNASAFVTNLHESQYDLSLGLTRLLLGEDPAPAATPRALVIGAPAAVWGLVVALFLAVTRFFRRTVPRWRDAQHGPTDARRWRRQLVLPAAGYLAVGALILLLTPLEAARHFAPDIGWGMTVLGCGAIVWAVIRTAVGLAFHRQQRKDRGQPRPTDPRPPMPADPDPTVAVGAPTT